MINQKFSDNLSLLTDKLNKSKFEDTPTSKSFPLDRLRASTLFLLEKKEYFSKNLNDLIHELNQMRNDSLKLFKNFSSRPATFQIVSYIKDLVDIAEQEEIYRSNNLHNLIPVRSTSSSSVKKEKVKIFKSSFAKTIEDDINKFLSENDVQITKTLQSTDDGTTCITIFYKDK